MTVTPHTPRHARDANAIAPRLPHVRQHPKHRSDRTPPGFDFPVRGYTPRHYGLPEGLSTQVEKAAQDEPLPPLRKAIDTLRIWAVPSGYVSAEAFAPHGAVPMVRLGELNAVLAPYFALEDRLRDDVALAGNGFTHTTVNGTHRLPPLSVSIHD